MNARIVSINTSSRKGVRKKAFDSAVLKENHGIESDAHASGKWHRQISLLAYESIMKMQEMGLEVDSGDFAENLTTEGIDLVSLPVGTKVRVGEEIEIEVSQIGKVCHHRCAIYYQTGYRVMPKEGIFAKVLSGGTVKKGDRIKVTDGKERCRNQDK